MPRFTVDIDTGGTFTDCYVTNGTEVVVAKTDTTPHDLSLGVLNAILQAAESLGLARRAFLERCEVVRLSTTVATNTFINRNGAKVGLLIGMRLARELERLAHALPLQRELIALIPEIVDESNIQSVRDATHALLEQGARILVIALDADSDLPHRESAVRDIVAGDYPRHYLGAVPVLPSHQVTPIADGVIRIQTAVLDAYVHPVMSRFLYRVEDQLRAEGLAYPLQVGNANGGTSRVAKTTALRTWGSGPAGGVVGAAEMATHLGIERAVAVDIGGTSADICIVAGRRWESEVSPSIEDVVVALPTLRLHSVGIGCGSIVRVVGETIVVGPDSAGAQPGPAAFGLGGDLATVTDAACCLSYFDPAHFLGGRRTLDVLAARRVVTEKIAVPLGITTESAAALIVERAVETIATAIRHELDINGIDGPDCVLFATGGGGGILGHAVAVKCGLAGVYAFPVSPVFSAFGLSRLDILHCYERMPAIDDLDHALETMRAVAYADMRGEGFEINSIRLEVEGEFGSGREITAEPLGSDFHQVVKTASERYRDLRLLRLNAIAPGRHASLARLRARQFNESAVTRQVSWGSTTTQTPVFDWLGLRDGTAIIGPALLETPETTLLIPPDARGVIGALGEVHIATDSNRSTRGFPAVKRASTHTEIVS